MANKLVIAAIAAFVAVDVVLAVAAVEHVRGQAPRGGDAISTPSETNASDSPTPSQRPESPQPSQSSQSQEPTEKTPSQGLLSIGVDGTILRATSGNCRSDETGEVAVSTDGGASFRTVFDDVPQVLRVVAVSSADLWFVSVDDACQPSVERSGDTGTSWAHSQGTAGAYHLSASADASLVHAPDGPVDVGCDAVGVAPMDADVAFVGCEDGTVRRTLDGGQSWVPRGHVDGLVSLTFRDAQTGFALAEQGRCASAVATTDDAGVTWTQVGCLDGDNPEAITTNAGTVVAQSAGGIEVSDDDGQTWTPAS